MSDYDTTVPGDTRTSMLERKGFEEVFANTGEADHVRLNALAAYLRRLPGHHGPAIAALHAIAARTKPSGP